MTAAPEPPPQEMAGELYHDGGKEPVYILTQTAFRRGDDEIDDPCVHIRVNGWNRILCAADAWNNGMKLIYAVYQVGNLNLPENMDPMIGFALDDEMREFHFPVTEAWNLGNTLINAAAVSVHIMETWNHLSKTVGWDDEELTKVFADFKPITLGDYLRQHVAHHHVPQQRVTGEG